MSDTVAAERGGNLDPADVARFRDVAGEFLQRHVLPDYAEWEAVGRPSAEVWKEAGRAGLLCPSAPENLGGLGLRDFRLNAVIGEQMAKFGVTSPNFRVHNDMVLPYLLEFGTDDQRQRWIPGMCSGDLIGAIAITEPGAGSDVANLRLGARAVEGGFILSGQKEYISNGMSAALILTAVRTQEGAGRRGLSLLMVEDDPGGGALQRHQLRKMGLSAQDTASLFFDDVFVPAENLIGRLDEGFVHLMQMLPHERLSVAIDAVATARAALDEVTVHALDRRIFGATHADLQNTRIWLGEMATTVAVGESFVESCIANINRGTLTANQAAMAKWWTTEMLWTTVDRSLQLHGGFGYMSESLIARRFLDARIRRISGGSNEALKDLIGRGLLKDRAARR
jgi:alkylation response protein AidB-like acyl-CoA dehydrogenase